MNSNRLGAIGALLDEYERVLLELQRVIKDISDQDLTTVVDTSTSDLNCRSVQTILTHVVSSGYSYAIYIRTLRGENLERPAKSLRSTTEEYRNDLDNVFAFTVETFATIHDGEIEQFDVAKKIVTQWGQIYDIEQMMEHAIVHVMRHRRQIEKFIIVLHPMVR